MYPSVSQHSAAVPARPARDHEQVSHGDELSPVSGDIPDTWRNSIAQSRRRTRRGAAATPTTQTGAMARTNGRRASLAEFELGVERSEDEDSADDEEASLRLRPMHVCVSCARSYNAAFSAGRGDIPATAPAHTAGVRYEPRAASLLHDPIKA